MNWQVLLYGAVAAIAGTGLGGVVTVFIPKRSDSLVCLLLSFASGIMISMVCFGLMPEAIGILRNKYNASGVYIAVAGLIAGVLIILPLNRLVDFITEKNSKAKHAGIHETPEELHHQTQLIEGLGAAPPAAGGQKRLLRSGIIMFIVLTLHNIPEGLAVGAGGAHDLGMGLMLAIMVGLHDIPEGIAIAAPLFAGGMKRWKAAGIAALSGVPEVFGVLLGILIGGVSDIAVGLSMSAAGGAMLYVVFGEMLPQSFVMTKSRITPIIALSGVLAGLLLTMLNV